MESHEFTMVYVSDIFRARQENIIDDKQAITELTERLTDTIPSLTFLDIYDVGQLYDFIDSLSELSSYSGSFLMHELDKQIDKLYKLCSSIGIVLN
jgi:hypothetical protein